MALRGGGGAFIPNAPNKIRGPTNINSISIEPAKVPSNPVLIISQNNKTSRIPIKAKKGRLFWPRKRPNNASKIVATGCVSTSGRNLGKYINSGVKYM